MRRSSLFALAFALICPVAASAQSNSRFGNSGPLGQGGLSSTPSMGGPTNPGSGTFGGTTTGLGGLSGSGLDTGGLSSGGSSGTGTGGTATGTQAPGLGDIGQTIGTGAFIGRSPTAGQVGNRFAGQTGTMGLGGFQQFQGLQGLGQGFGGQRGGSGFNNQFNGGGSQDRLSVRPTMRIAFDAPPATAAVATERVTARLVNVVERRPELANVTVLADDAGRVVLRGNVATQDARELAAALVRLEPGVRELVNELTVAPGAAR